MSLSVNLSYWFIFFFKCKCNRIKRHELLVAFFCVRNEVFRGYWEFYLLLNKGVKELSSVHPMNNSEIEAKWAKLSPVWCEYVSVWPKPEYLLLSCWLYNFTALSGCFTFFFVKVANKALHISQRVKCPSNCSLIILKMRLSLAVYQRCLHSRQRFRLFRSLLGTLGCILLLLCCPPKNMFILKALWLHQNMILHNATLC